MSTIIFLFCLENSMFGCFDAPVRFGSNHEHSSTKDLYRNAALHSGFGAEVRATAGQLDRVTKAWFAMPVGDSFATSGEVSSWTFFPRLI